TPAVLTTKDKRTLEALRSLADTVVQFADRSKAPFVDIPSRSLSNVRYNSSQAKSYMQTILVGSGCTALIEQGKTTSLRGLYYMLKHTIEGTKEETFEEQGESDTIIEDVEVTLNSLR